MANEDQAQADLPTETSVADPMDVANSTTSGTKSAMDDYQAEVEAALRAEPNERQGDEPAEDEPEESQENATESEENETQSGESDEDGGEEDEPEAKTPKRIRLSDPLDQKVAAVAKAMGVNLIEAAKIVEAQNPTRRQDSEDSQETAESSASVTAAIKQLQAQKREKLTALEFEDAADIDDQIEELRDKRENLKIAELQSKANAEQADAQKFYADYAKSEEKTIGFYPDAAVKDSAMYKEIAKLDAEMREMGDPLYYSTDKPFILAKEAAKNLGIPMKKPGSVPVKKSVQHRPIQPAGGNARTTATEPTKRAKDAIDGLQSMRDYQDMVNAL